RYNGNQRRPDLVANPTATPNPVCEAGPANRRGQCPAASTYCTASVSGSRLKDGDGSDCADGTLEGGGNNGASVGNGGGCPDVNQYCGGNGMTLYDSCGRLCPGGYGRALPFCCAGCNSAGNPPSFKRDYSCQDFINLTGGGTCAQDQNTNCYQFTPP
ncbi:MAG TPA: hypothetical protein VFV50_10160, partial [Bdellovibrionales bacterium]|nr:hypothetical protein [Bdellovibrionales bacterium]